MKLTLLVRNAAFVVCALVVSTGALAQAATPRPANKSSPPAADAKQLPTDDAAMAEVDTAFKQWSSAWMFDRYVPGSARATERGLKDQTYVVRGMFDFARSGSKLTIPFAAAYTKPKDRFVLSNLCYNDVSTGMTDCINPTESLDGRRAAVAQSRQLMGSIVLLGLVAAMAAEEETCVKQYTLFGEPYFVCD